MFEIVSVKDQHFCARFQDLMEVFVKIPNI